MKKIIIPIAILFVIASTAVIIINKHNKNRSNANQVSSKSTGDLNTTKTTSSNNQDPWGGRCQIKEHGKKELTVSPLEVGSISIVSPMGLTAGGHVTPIDHMYFYPVPTPGDRFSAKVLAAGDGVITSIQHRGNLTDAPPTAKPSTDEFRLTIEQTCNQGYYYDLVTKLAPNLKEAVGNLSGGDSKGVSIPVKAGDLIGYVGNQSLDFGVYDTTVTLGFIVPEHYQGEIWKIHTADAFAYFQKDVLTSFLPKVARSAEPRAGKIDYDKDGYLIGNWFEQGTNGYSGKDGTMGQDYWDGHLALLYDAYDPHLITISMGRYKGHDPQAFATIGNAPDPGTVNQETGLVKYELTKTVNYYLANGSSWDRQTAQGSVTAKPGTDVEGTVLFQLTGPRLLKMEVFPGQTSNQVTGFTTNARTYER